MNKLAVFGDVHGKYTEYMRLTKLAEYSIQVGDMGFNYKPLTGLLGIDPARHRVLGGNHDNYERGPCPACTGASCPACDGRGFLFVQQSPHFLGDFGTWEVPDFGPVFYVRGAWSIDFQWRQEGRDWWRDEEMSAERCQQALEAYIATRPSFVVTHTAPASVIPNVPFNRIFGDKIHGTRTESLLEAMYDAHQPAEWVFGHWHTDWESIIERRGHKTRFVCLDELSVRWYAKLPLQFGSEDL